ncbi:rhodopsin isoform X3 [Lepeophtheirus salmonis]
MSLAKGDDETEFFNTSSSITLGPNTVDDDIWSRAYAPKEVDPMVYNISCCYLGIIGVVGILGNGYSITLYISRKKLQTPFNFVLMNLIYAEFLSAAYGIPVDFAASFAYGWKFGKVFCIITGFILTTTGMVCIFTLTYLTVHRYFCVFHPFFVSYVESKYIIISSTIWILSLSISIPPLFGWSTYAPESSGMSCAPSWEDEKYLMYLVYILILGFIIPSFIFMYTSFSIICCMKKTMLEHRVPKRKNTQDRKSRINRMVLLMVLCFQVCWFPYAFVSMYRVFIGDVPVIYTVFPVQFAKSGVCWNPFIYIIMNKEFKKEMVLDQIGIPMQKTFPNASDPTMNENMESQQSIEL